MHLDEVLFVRVANAEEDKWETGVTLGFFLYFTWHQRKQTLLTEFVGNDEPRLLVNYSLLLWELQTRSWAHCVDVMNNVNTPSHGQGFVLSRNVRVDNEVSSNQRNLRTFLNLKLVNKKWESLSIYFVRKKIETKFWNFFIDRVVIQAEAWIKWISAIFIWTFLDEKETNLKFKF